MITVLQVAYPLAPVGPDAVGGAEQVLAMIDAALVRAGHRSIVVACAGSTAHGTLVATPRVEGALDDAARERAQAAHRAAIARVLREEAVDLVHLHGVDFAAYVPPPGPAALATLHLPPAWYPAEVFAPARPRTWLNCVSRSQRARCPDGPVVDVVPNGVDVARFRPRGRKGRFVLAMGRICPEKGWHLALRAARMADVPLVLAGEVFGYAAHQRYFREEVAPLLDARRRFVGPVGGARKRRLLAAARCLLCPSLAPETSSLVAMEALACGTPVVAFPAGALPEVVEDGRTGFVVDGVEAMAAAIGRVADLRSADCRAAAEARFSAEAMTARYLELYARLR